MASSGNQNQQQQGPFDVQRFFNPSSPPPITSNPNLTFQNPNTIPYPPQSSAASYPPPTVTGADNSYSYPPQTNPMYHPHFHVQTPQFYPENHNQMTPTNLQHQRSVPYPRPSLQPPNPNPNPNHGARLMALLSAPPPTIIDNISIPLNQPANNPMIPSSLVPALHYGNLGSGPLRIPIPN